MIKKILWLVAILPLLAACAQVIPQPTPTATSAPTKPRPTATPLPPTSTIAPSRTPTPTIEPSPTLNYPVEGMGPDNFPNEVDPLTGLTETDPTLLDRRPVVIKVENLPREHRPQYGLSLADIVYEYYTEQGTTRFAAIYYGQDAEKVGPIRSGRFFDVNVVQMYKGVFVFGSAYTAVWNRIVNSDFGNRLVLENQYSCPALCRFEPDKSNLLLADTKEMNAYLKTRAINNARQTLNGMFFKQQIQPGGQPAGQVFVRYSGAIYNRWDYDPTSGKYLRFEDAQNDINNNNEVYNQLTDKLNGNPVTADTVVTICVPHRYYAKTTEIEVVEMLMDAASGAYTGCDGKTYQGGTGAAYVARDGQMYKATWSRPQRDSVLTLVGEDGQPFPFKPGQTWFEVIGASSKVEQKDNAFRFTFVIVP